VPPSFYVASPVAARGDGGAKQIVRAYETPRLKWSGVVKENKKCQ